MNLRPFEIAFVGVAAWGTIVESRGLSGATGGEGRRGGGVSIWELGRSAEILPSQAHEGHLGP